jgi:ketosteroid isomerase-like protein
MYKMAERWMIRRNIRQLTAGSHRAALAMLRDDATLAFPGDNMWSSQHRPAVKGRERFATHRGRAEIEAFLRSYPDAAIQMTVEDILVNGPPWNTRAAVRVHLWSAGANGGDRYSNRAVLWAEASWGKIRAQEDYEDTERSSAFSAALNVPDARDH